jgi:hypothetical protein
VFTAGGSCVFIPIPPPVEVEDGQAGCCTGVVMVPVLVMLLFWSMPPVVV